AGKIGGEEVVVVKDGGACASPLQAADLAARGIVDRAFPLFLASSGARASIVAAEAHTSTHKAITERGTPGTPIDLHERVARRLLAPLWPKSKSHAGDGR